MAGIAAALSILLLAVTLHGNFILQTEHIRLTTDGFPTVPAGLRIAHLSDIHLPHMPTGIGQILSQTEKAHPDLILLTGDLVDQTAQSYDLEALQRLCAGLAAIAPCYAVSGNHEAWSGLASQWEEALRDAGITIVDDGHALFSKGGDTLVIAGLADETAVTRLEQILPATLPSGALRILLSHQPDKFAGICALPEAVRPVLVFSGHAHGGQFRIPFTRIGLVAPGQGFFPTYTSGVYTGENGVRMVVSRGLGNSVLPVRLFNPPHLIIVEYNAN